MYDKKSKLTIVTQLLIPGEESLCTYISSSYSFGGDAEMTKSIQSWKIKAQANICC